MEGASGAGMPHNSTMSGFGGSKKIKDDKSFVQQSIKQLHEFLTEQGFPGPLSSKILQSPSTKDFVKMFEFIYQQLNPTYEMPKSKVEEEVPAILKALRCRLFFPKSFVRSVGTSYTWTRALAVLIWLIDTVKEKDILQNSFLTELKKLYTVDDAQLALMEEKYRTLSDEVKRLEKDNKTDRLMTTRMEKVKLQADLQKLHSYRRSLDSFKAKLEESRDLELKDELETNLSLLETLKQERDEMQHLLQNQKFTFADVERIYREKRELQQTISSLTKSHENDEHKWNEEIALAKVNEKIKLMELISDVKEEISHCSNMELSLEESCEQVNSNITDESNDLKQLKEQIRKLDERLDSKMQELEREEQDLAEEMESADNHLKLLEKKVNFIYDEAVQQLKAAQQQYHLVLQETNEKRRTVANNLASVFITAANDLSITENCLEDLYSQVQRICSKAVEEDKASLQKMQETVKNFISKANNM